MKCPNCRCDVPDSSPACRYCGIPLRPRQHAYGAPPTGRPPVYSRPGGTRDTGTTPVQQVYRAGKPAKTRRAYTDSALTAALVLLCGIFILQILQILLML